MTTPAIEPKALTLEELRQAVAGAGAAFRLHTRLQPAGGAGDKVFPPTYTVDDKHSRTKYAVEQRRIGGTDVDVVLLDSVASQANRMEEALHAAWESGQLDFPVIGVDFGPEPELADLGRITTLQAPHRIADALLRDALTADGLPFRDAPEGKAYTQASVRNASTVFRLCPTALIFGVWDSTGPKGGSGAKFQRALVSEVVGVGFSAGVKTGSRIDPAGIQANVNVYHREGSTSDWTAEVSEAQRDKQGRPVLFNRSGAEGKGKPSAINHSNVAPSIDSSAGGVTFDYAQQTAVLSLPALRRLRFVEDQHGQTIGPESRPAAETAARTALAALALAAVALARDNGLDLRSRSLLVPEQGTRALLELVSADGAPPQGYELTGAQAIDLVRQTAALAALHGLGWVREPLSLKPMPKLAALIRESRRLAAAGEGDSAGAS
jgi:CRISPR-associated protein Csb1